MARDAATGQLGVAVQSHWFSVGPIVPWARPGVGAVATQANVEVSYGPRALDLMAGGMSAGEALATLLAADEGAEHRQVAVIDAGGGLAVHTGAQCIAYAGDAAGENVSCQANMMASETVWPAMLAAYRDAEGPLVRRLLAALDAAEAQGGAARGRQSAAVLVVPPAGESWECLVSLRVEDHPEPLIELRRLLDLHEAYALAGEADGLVAAGRHDAASASYRRARELAPDSHELLFWAGLGAAQGGDLAAGVADVEAAIAIQPGWRALLERLPAELAPGAAAVLQALNQEDGE